MGFTSVSYLVPANTLLECRNRKWRILPMQHGVAVRAHRHKVFQGVRRGIAATVCERDLMVDVNEAFGKFSVSFAEVNVAHTAPDAVCLQADPASRTASLKPDSCDGATATLISPQGILAQPWWHWAESAVLYMFKPQLL